MSGHSKWSTIKRQKASQDQKRGQIFTKLATAIAIAVRESGGNTDPNSNFKLRLAMERARSANMPKANIDRAIARGAGKERENEQLSSIVYEGFGPASIGIIVEVITDNKNRAQSEVRSVFTKAGGQVAQSGAVSYLFEHVGLITVEYSGGTDDALELALTVGADDVMCEDSEAVFVTKPEQLHHVTELLKEQSMVISDSVLGWRPLQLIEIPETKKQSIISLLETLDDLDDVQAVYSNAAV